MKRPALTTVVVNGLVQLDYRIPTARADYRYRRKFFLCVLCPHFSVSRLSLFQRIESPPKQVGEEQIDRRSEYDILPHSHSTSFIVGYRDADVNLEKHRLIYDLQLSIDDSYRNN